MDFPTQIYIDGELVDGSGSRDVFNPATEACIATSTVLTKILAQ